MFHQLYSAEGDECFKLNDTESPNIMCTHIRHCKFAIGLHYFSLRSEMDVPTSVGLSFAQREWEHAYPQSPEVFLKINVRQKKIIGKINQMQK
jgi:hypothetical protein